MDEILFPTQYKKALLSKKKNMTIRIKEEIGKYKPGKVYLAKSYSGKDWDIKIRVLKRTLTTPGKLFFLGVPKKSIESMKNREKISSNEEVELIQFKVL